MRNRENYPENWEDTIRPDILKRDNYTCKGCGAKHRQSYIFLPKGKKIAVTDEEMKEAKANGERAYKVFLQVAHKDQDPGNNNYKNLISFCKACHLKFDRSHNALKKSLFHIAKQSK